MATAEFRYVTTQLYSPVVTITAAASNGIITTYTANNSFTQGQTVTITGVSPSQFNVTGNITSRTNTYFAIDVPVAGTYVSGGKATGNNPIIAELPFTNVSFTSQLNSVGTFQGHVLLSGLNSNELNAYDGTVPGKTILWVLYTDPQTYTSIPVWSGVIWAREYDSASQTLSISAQEMLSLFNRRRISTTKDYSATNYDPAYIAQQLVLYSESLNYGNIGLSYDVGSTIYATKKIYYGYELKSVYQAIKDLAQNYFDFKIKPMVMNGNLINVFYVRQTIGTTYSTSSPIATVFQFPGNLIAYKFPEDASGAANKLYGLGYGANNSKVIAIATDSSQYGTPNNFPLLEDTANYIDIGDNQLLKDVTLGQLNAISYPPTTVEVIIPPYVDPFYPQYNVGDQVRLMIQDDYFPSGIDTTGTSGNLKPFRIMAITTAPGESGPSRITLTLTRDLSSGSVV